MCCFASPCLTLCVSPSFPANLHIVGFYSTWGIFIAWMMVAKGKYHGHFVNLLLVPCFDLFLPLFYPPYGIILGQQWVEFSGVPHNPHYYHSFSGDFPSKYLWFFLIFLQNSSKIPWWFQKFFLILKNFILTQNFIFQPSLWFFKSSQNSIWVHTIRDFYLNRPFLTFEKLLISSMTLML